MDGFVVFAARYLIIIPPLVLLHLIWTRPERERVPFVALTVFSLLLAFIFAKVGTTLYDNPRPFMVGDFVPLIPHGIENGFPSMHALFAATIAILAATKSLRVGALLAIIAIMIGTGRIVGGVHHTVDVIAAILIAVAAVALSRMLLSIRVRRRFH